MAKYIGSVKEYTQPHDDTTSILSTPPNTTCTVAYSGGIGSTAALWVALGRWKTTVHLLHLTTPNRSTIMDAVVQLSRDWQGLPLGSLIQANSEHLKARYREVKADMTNKLLRVCILIAAANESGPTCLVWGPLDGNQQHVLSLVAPLYPSVTHWIPLTSPREAVLELANAECESDILWTSTALEVTERAPGRVLPPTISLLVNSCEDMMGVTPADHRPFPAMCGSCRNCLVYLNAWTEASAIVPSLRFAVFQPAWGQYEDRSYEKMGMLSNLESCSHFSVGTIGEKKRTVVWSDKFLGDMYVTPSLSAPNVAFSPL